MKKIRNSSLFKMLYLLVISLFMLVVPAWGQANKALKSQPKTGEGLYEFLLRNGRSLDYVDEFIRLNKKKLGKNNALKLGFYYIIPTKDSINSKNASTPQEGNAAKKQTQSLIGKTITEPLFGPSKQTFKIESEKLKGACFYVVSGHGGPDPGAIGKMGRHHLHEDEYAYDIALRLARDLMKHGAKVYIIIQDAKDGIREDRILSNSKRETCMGARIPLDQLGRLKQRADKINQLYAQDKKNYKYCRAVFLHIDSRSQRKQVDVFFYHFAESPKGKQLAQNMRNMFTAKYDLHQPSRGFTGTVSSRNLYVLKNTHPVALFVELGNIQNSFDQRRIVSSSNRQALAKWMAHGFIDDYQKEFPQK